MHNLRIKSLASLKDIAPSIVSLIGTNKIVCFYGSMGAGKTTLIKAICEEMGVKDVVASPTFALINEYKDRNGKKIFHFDFYRINKIEEVYDFGYEEYFYNPEGLCLIEWPELIEEILPSNGVCKLKITVNPDESRDVKIWS